MGTLTHEQMREVISQGGSVMINGHIVTSHDMLPSQADLAVGDEELESAAAAAIDAQVAELLRQRAKVTRDKERQRELVSQQNKERHAQAQAQREADRKAGKSVSESSEEEEPQIGELPEQGDNIGQEEREEEHRIASSAPEETDEPPKPRNAQPGPRAGRHPDERAGKGK